MPDFSDLYDASGQRWNVDPALLQSIARVESGEGQNLGPSRAGAYGVMQFMPATAKQYGVDVTDPASSIDGAAHYMSDLLTANGGNVPTALATYNGSGSDQRQTYARSIATNYTPRINVAQPPPPQPQPTSNATASADAPTASAAPAMSSQDIIGSLGGTPPAPPPASGGGPSAPPPTDQIPTVTVTAPRPSGAAGSGPSAPPSMSNQDIISSLTAGGTPPPAAAKNIDPVTGQPYQYASTADSPVGQATGKPIAEGQVPGAAFQAKVNIATDPEQQRRIAAATLFPNLPQKDAQARVYYGDDGRLAAVDDNGNPYYIQPQRVLPPGALSVDPFGGATPLSSGGNYSPGNLLRGAGAAAPGAVVGGLQTAPALLSGPVGSTIGVGAMTAATEAGRQWLANQLDPGGGVPIDVGSLATDVGTNMLLNVGGRGVNWLMRDVPVAGPRGTSERLPPAAPTAPAAPRTVFGRAAPDLPPEFANAPFAEGYTAPGAPAGPTSAVPFVASPEEIAQARAVASGAAPAPPIARPGAAAPGAPAPTFLDNAWIRQAGDTGQGYDMGKGGAALADAAQRALDQGATVNFVTDGGRKTVNIASVRNGQMIDDKGQPWGSFTVAVDPTGREGLRISGGTRPGAGPQGAAAPGASAGPATVGLEMNPGGEASHLSGPYAPSTPAEVASVPNALPPLRAPIISQAGANARADQIIRWFAANGPVDADLRELVPGSAGSLAQVTGNAGLATLERGVRSLPESANIFSALDTAQQNARRAMASDLVGTPEQLAAKVAERDAATTEMRNAAFANTKPTDASAAVAEMDRVLRGPDGKVPGISQPLSQLRPLFFDHAGNLETDPEMLYGVRRAINYALGPLARGTSADARAAASQLAPVLSKLDTAIEAGAPGFKPYMREFANRSSDIDAMQYLQGRNLKDVYGNVQLGPLNATLRDIERQQAMSGARKADHLTDQQVQTLQNLRDDLLRQANLRKGKALGSDTFQNLATNTATNLLTGAAGRAAVHSAGAYFGGPVGLAVTMGGEHLLSAGATRAERLVRDALVDRLLNRNGSGVAALRQRAAERAAPAPAVAGTGRAGSFPMGPTLVGTMGMRNALMERRQSDGARY